jgi:Wax ester synthase/diacylglycerol acyltransferase catalytic domain
MQQLTGFDASFLHMENGRTTGHVAFLAIFDPPTAHGPLALEDVVRLFEQSIHLVPYYRRRLVEVPFGINHPYWMEDPDFDLDFHIRHIAVPPPGDDRQLAELVARLHARPLDRARPLWEFYLIEGLSGDRVAQYSKVHHCAVDGISGMEALTLMLDLVPEPRKVPFPESPWTAEPVPDQLEMFGRGALGLVEHPRRVFRLVRSFQTLARPAGGAPGARPWLLHATSMPNTPVHTDAAIDGLRAAGIRALHCYGFFAATRDNPAFRTHEHRRADFARVARSHSSAGGLLKIGAALTEVGVLPWNDTVAEIQAAREAGARMVLHTGCVWGSVVTLGVKEMHGHRLLGPDQVHVTATRSSTRNGRCSAMRARRCRSRPHDGAEACGLESLIGSPKPGKQADVIVVGGPESLALRPHADPVASVVFQAAARDVRDVFVAGKHRRRDGRLVGVDLGRLLDEAERSAASILGRVRALSPKLPPRPAGGFEATEALARAHLAAARAQRS